MPISYAEASRREKAAKAALLELRLKRERGELIEWERVREVAAKTAAQVRAGLEAIPSKVAPTVAGMSSPGDIVRYLQKEMKAILSDLARRLADNEF
jgi:hypothetical protein